MYVYNIELPKQCPLTFLAGVIFMIPNPRRTVVYGFTTSFQAHLRASSSLGTPFTAGHTTRYMNKCDNNICRATSRLGVRYGMNENTETTTIKSRPSILHHLVDSDGMLAKCLSGCGFSAAKTSGLFLPKITFNVTNEC